MRCEPMSRALMSTLKMNNPNINAVYVNALMSFGWDRELANLRDILSPTYLRGPRDDLDFHAIKRTVVNPFAIVHQEYEARMEQWGCRYVSTRGAWNVHGKIHTFITREGFPHRVVTRLAAITNTKLSLVSFRYRANETYLLEVKPQTRSMKLSRITYSHLRREVRDAIGESCDANMDLVSQDTD